MNLHSSVLNGRLHQAFEAGIMNSEKFELEDISFVWFEMWSIIFCVHSCFFRGRPCYLVQNVTLQQISLVRIIQAIMVWASAASGS